MGVRVLRHLGRRSTLLTTVAGFAVSLLIEFTQLTGNWFLYPCPYRLFDVDDLLANTAGALLGALAAPVLRLLPRQDVHGDPDAPRPVTTRRRLHGVACDLIGVWLAGGLLGMAVNVVTLVVTGDFVPRAGQEGFTTVVTWTVWLVLFAVLPVLGGVGRSGSAPCCCVPCSSTAPARRGRGCWRAAWPASVGSCC